MDTTPLPKLEEPRFETTPAMLMAGLRQTYSYGGNAGIPSQWQQFNVYFGEIPGQIGVQSIPLMVLFKGGQPVAQKLGAAPKSQLKGWIESVL